MAITVEFLRDYGGGTYGSMVSDAGRSVMPKS